MAISFEKAVIVGLGLIGGSLAAAFKRKNVLDYIIGIDNEAIISKGKEKKLIKKGFEKHDHFTAPICAGGFIQINETF